MSISRIPNLLFVHCATCAYRKKRKDLRRRPHTYYFCELNQHELYGQEGCSDGSKLKGGQIRW